MISYAKSLLRRLPVYPAYRHWKLQRDEFREFWRPKESDLQCRLFYRQFFNTGDVVFDVGANVGVRTRVFHALGARTIAFEPQSQCYCSLMNVFRSIDTVQVINKALGKSPGSLDMYISNVNVLSSLSPQWMESVRESGRFADFRWEKKEVVEVTTLDETIKSFGIPKFIKIDVEGFEAEVIRGLSRPIDFISIEFAPEFIKGTFDCVDHLASLSKIQCQISLGESMQFMLDGWVSPEELKDKLARIDPKEFGDVYISAVQDSRLQ